MKEHWWLIATAEELYADNGVVCALVGRRDAYAAAAASRDGVITHARAGSRRPEAYTGCRARASTPALAVGEALLRAAGAGWSLMCAPERCLLASIMAITATPKVRRRRPGRARRGKTCLETVRPSRAAAPLHQMHRLPERQSHHASRIASSVCDSAAPHTSISDVDAPAAPEPTGGRTWSEKRSM